MLKSSKGTALIWTAVVYQLMVSSNAQNNGPGYLGCFQDGTWFGRSLRGDSTASDRLSVDRCFKFCLIKDYKYAGVESETECYCGNNEDYGRRGRAADSECRDTCPGISNQLCGGHWRKAIYQISKAVCNNDAIVSPVHGSHEVTNPTHSSFNLVNSKLFGTRVRFGCDTGYDIQGAETIECTQMGANAKWSNSVPTCIRPTVVPQTTISDTAPSVLPTTKNQTNTSIAMTTISYTATPSVLPTTKNQTIDTNVTSSSGLPSSTPGATVGREMPNQQTSQTGTIVGTVVGVIAALVILLVIVIVIFRRRGKKRNTSSGVAMVNVTYSINKKQGDSDESTEPNQASTFPVYSQVVRKQTKDENDHVYANPDGVNNSVANAAYEVNLDIRPASNEHDKGTGLVDNILYVSSSLKDESEMKKNDLNEEHAGATMQGEPGWVENIIYE